MKEQQRITKIKQNRSNRQQAKSLDGNDAERNIRERL